MADLLAVQRTRPVAHGTGALQLQAAFDKSNSDLQKQIGNLEKLAAARKAEGGAAEQAARLYDTEAQQRRAKALADAAGRILDGVPRRVAGLLWSEDKSGVEGGWARA